MVHTPIIRTSEDAGLLANHQSALATWTVQRLGHAMLVGALVGFLTVVGLTVAFDGDPDSGTGWAGLVVGVLVIAFFLATSKAPLPVVRRDED